MHGELASLAVPDPEHVRRRRAARTSGPRAHGRTSPSRRGTSDASRGAGLLDFIAAGRDSGPGRASGQVALHSLDAMTALLESAETGRRIVLTTTVERPDAVPLTPTAQWKAGAIA